MGIKNISYFRQNESTNETIRILDCGYHETIQGHCSAQTMIDHYVLHCIVSGKGIYQIYDRTYHLKANDCFLLMPNVPILYQSDEEDPWVYYWMGFGGIDVLPLMQLCNIGSSCPVLHYEPIGELTSIIAPLVAMSEAAIPDSYIALGQFYLLCSRLMQRNRNIKPLSRKEYYVSQAVSLIQDSYFKNISVKSVSDAIGLDRTYLYRIFKEITGVPVQQYITNLRLKRACHFLSGSGLSYSEIAYFCGYSSEQYFSMVFKNNIGVSPSAYRKTAARREEARAVTAKDIPDGGTVSGI